MNELENWDEDEVYVTKGWYHLHGKSYDNMCAIALSLNTLTLTHILVDRLRFREHEISKLNDYSSKII